MEQKTGTLISDIIGYLLEGDMKRFEKYLASLLLTVSSYHDGTAVNISGYVQEVDEDHKYENFYHGLILGRVSPF